MPIKTPKFWYRPLSSPPSFFENLLLPISHIYKFAHNLNINNQQAKAVPIPVLCIGNITAGGSGKTPTIIAINKLIKDNNIFNAPYFLTRGYGGNNNNPRCITIHDDVKETGDEPLLLAKHAKTIISTNRYDGATLANSLGADCILMDDGFQNQTIHKNLSFIVIDGKIGLGNQKIIPAGPLREPIDMAIKRAQAIILIGEDKTNIRSIIPKQIPILTAKIKAIKIDRLNINATYIAFAGLAHPQKFYDTLLENNIKISSFYKFADHHQFSNKEIEKIINNARNNNVKIITTEKDYQRIPNKYKEHINYLPINLIWDNEKEILDFLKNLKFCSKNN